jgi:hypothetical protein
VTGDSPSNALGRGVDAIDDAPPPVDPIPRALAEAEEQYGEVRTKLERARLLNERLQEQNEDLRQDRSERKDYADRIFQLVCLWLGAVGFIVFLQATSPRFNLPDSVLLAILGGTTASVISIFIIVANYLFPRARTPDESTTNK